MRIYEFLINVRNVSRTLKLPIVITTETLKNSYIYSQFPNTATKDVLLNILNVNYKSYILDSLVISLKSAIEGNKYYKELKNWKDWED